MAVQNPKTAVDEKWQSQRILKTRRNRTRFQNTSPADRKGTARPTGRKAKTKIQFRLRKTRRTDQACNGCVRRTGSSSKGREISGCRIIWSNAPWLFPWKENHSGATRTAREIGRSMKESRDKEGAEANLKTLQQERANLETQFQSEVNALETKTNPLTEDLENFSITPTKTNITVRLVALVWTLK